MDYPEVRSSGGLQYGGDKRAAAAPGPEGRDLNSQLAAPTTANIYKKPPNYAITSPPGSGLWDAFKDPLGIPERVDKLAEEDPSFWPAVLASFMAPVPGVPWALDTFAKTAGNFLLGPNPTEEQLNRAAASTTEKNWLKGSWGRREGELTIEDTFAYLDDDRPDNDRREYGGAFGSRVSGNVPAGPGATLTPPIQPYPSIPLYPSIPHDHASHFHPPVADVPDVASPNPLTGVRLFRNLPSAQPGVTTREVPVTPYDLFRQRRRQTLRGFGGSILSY